MLQNESLNLSESPFTLSPPYVLVTCPPCTCQDSRPRLHSVLSAQNFMRPINNLQLLFNLREPRLLAQALSFLLLLDNQDSVWSQELHREVSCARAHQKACVGI